MRPIITCVHINPINWVDSAECELNSDEVNVWKISIPKWIVAINDLKELLSKDEHTRAGRYHYPNDHERFVVSRGALRILLSRYLKTDAKTIVFESGPNRKPFVKNTGGLDIHYNTTHSGDDVLIAIAAMPVGIDVENLEPMFPYQDILEHTFNRQEISVIDESENPLETFYRLWTRKEALLKATGKGIDDDMKLIPCTDGQHRIDRALIGSDANWFVNSFIVDGSYSGSVAAGTNNINFVNFELK
ncbi:4'-phosphopantetheinyl transferase family protein [Mucilaginibacter sp. AW1-3]